MNLAGKLWQRARQLLPLEGLHFDRPIVVLQSDDWGRVGLRDHEGLDQLRAAGLSMGERAYDLYTLETVEDLTALSAMLSRHRDSVGRSPCVGMNFILANLDFARMQAEDFKHIHVLPLNEGFPAGWNRPGLLDAYREGIAKEIFRAFLHGTTHFNREAVELELANASDRAQLLRTLWQAGTPYIHWRMPWIGYEYWNPGKSDDERFLSFDSQRDLIGATVGAFAKMFSTVPHSACAPGYRANDDTHRAWSEYGIRVAQNGPGTLSPPHMGRHGLLHLYRNVEFEPATADSFSMEECVRRAQNCFERNIPAIVSVHSINFHSTVRDFRTPTLDLLDQFLTVLQAKHSDLLYLHDEDLYELVTKGSYETARGTVQVNVTKKKFTRAQVTGDPEAQ